MKVKFIQNLSPEQIRSVSLESLCKMPEKVLSSIGEMVPEFSDFLASV